ncbi:MAG TPA: NfeD family protein [Candidatus Binatia bacterium]|nr:NfeD family protein [Candidatus Binatia bacterium]
MTRPNRIGRALAMARLGGTQCTVAMACRALRTACRLGTRSTRTVALGVALALAGSGALAEPASHASASERDNVAATAGIKARSSEVAGREAADGEFADKETPGKDSAGSESSSEPDAPSGSPADAARHAQLDPEDIASAPFPTVLRIRIEGPITPAAADYLATAIDRAVEVQALALVVELDTPGGLLDSTKTIVKTLLSAPVPVLVHVSPGGASATSAGVFVTIAAHVAAMAPGTSIGAAHPVAGGGKDIEGDMRKKVENFTASFGSSIAQRRGRNVEWAEKAVRESVAVTEKEAVELKVVDFVAESLPDLLNKASGREVEVGGHRITLDLRRAFDDAGAPRVLDVEMTLRQRVLSVVSDPNIAYLLMMVAMLGLYMELSNPGAVVPGVVGTIALLLALLASQVLPISGAGALLIILGAAFLVAELFVPSFGIIGFGGILALALGSLFLYTPESSLYVDRRLIGVTVGMLAAILAMVVLVLVRDRRRRPTGGFEGLIGETGVAVTDIAASGKIRVRGELWNASSASAIAAGTSVRVDSVTGLKVRVSPQQGETR